MKIIFFLLIPIFTNGQMRLVRAGRIQQQPTDTTYQWLVDNSRAVWDMTNGIDKTGHGYDLVGSTGSFTSASAQVPSYRTYYNFDNAESPMTAVLRGTVPLLPAGHESLLRLDHEFHININSTYIFSNNYILGTSVGNHVYYLRILNTGQLVFSIRSRSTATCTLTTVDAIFPGIGTDNRRACGQKYIRLRVDYNSAVTIWVNGGRVATTSVGDAVPQNATYYLGTNPFGIGAANVNNTTTEFPVTYFKNVGLCAVTELLSDSEAFNLLKYFVGSHSISSSSNVMRVILPKNPTLSTKSRITIGVKFDTPPAGSVDVTITGARMATINKTLTVQQCNEGYAFSFFANYDSTGFEFHPVTVSAVGYSDVTVNTYVSSDIEDVIRKWTPLLTIIDGIANWRYEIPTFTNVSEKRTSLINDVFISSNGTVPSGSPHSIHSPSSSPNGVILDNANSATKVVLKFRENDPQGYYWESDFGWSQNTTPSTVLVIDHLGHGEPGHDLMYNAIMNAGYDYANCALPGATNNPNITASFPTDRHDQMQTLFGTSSYDIRRLFLFDKIRALDYILSQKSYTKIILIGISGGGAMSTLWGSIDTRINKIFCDRGYGTQGQPYGGGDAEQGAGTLDDRLWEGSSGPLISASIRKNTRVDMMALCGAGREFHLINHITDDCCWKGYYSDVFEVPLREKIESFGGEYNRIHFTNDATKVHGYHTSDDIAYLLDNI